MIFELFKYEFKFFLVILKNICLWVKLLFQLGKFYLKITIDVSILKIAMEIFLVMNLKKKLKILIKTSYWNFFIIIVKIKKIFKSQK